MATTALFRGRLRGTPSIRELAWAIMDAKSLCCEENDHNIDVRLQVVDGTWTLHTGDPCYDDDHRGWWGAGIVEPTTNSTDLAKTLIADMEDHAAQCGEFDDE